MNKFKYFAAATVLVSMQSIASDNQEIRVEHYYEAIEFDRMTECVSDNKIYSVGMIIEKDGTRFVCNNFRHDSDQLLDKSAPASWRVKSAVN